MKRSFEFTHQEIDLIINCLLIASSQYNDEFERLNKEYPHEPAGFKTYWFDKSNQIYNLANDIKNSKFDV